ncbi:hypothetical protein HS088_TW12G00831 [Tripterygium wilfordii]|uniref:Uncharacterized protein n=1 Tax=Tripterygium wilfordii TaxID=458696 RepID=A0A7J7CZT2_TRIWF|nr:hypothetical protein HS088_TW12G00831 [Tripterygium wilfordii]
MTTNHWLNMIHTRNSSKLRPLSNRTELLPLPSNQDKIVQFLQMQKEEEEEASAVAICPSFNSYSCDGLAEVAARVRTEASTSNQQLYDEEDTFEFTTDFDFSSSMMASQIRPVFPVFNRDLMLSDYCFGDEDDLHWNQDHDRDTDFGAGDVEVEDVARARLSLKNMFVDEPDHSSSCSSSEADELDEVPPGTHCFWTPKSPSPSPLPGRCKKSNSTGSCSKRWRFRDLLKRSISDGKAGSLVFVNAEGEKRTRVKASAAATAGGGALKIKVKGETAAAAHKAIYVKNKAAKGGDKRRSYLPYRQELLSFFSHKNFLPF